MADKPIKERIESDMNACCYREHCRAQARMIAALESDLEIEREYGHSVVAERNALRSRIYGAPRLIVRRQIDTGDGDTGKLQCDDLPEDYIGKRVHLVVEQEGDRS